MDLLVLQKIHIPLFSFVYKWCNSEQSDVALYLEGELASVSPIVPTLIVKSSSWRAETVSVSRRCCLWKHLHVAFRNKARKHSCGRPALRPPHLHRGGRSTRLPEGSKPRAASSPHAVRSVDSVVTCSRLRRRPWQKQAASLRVLSFCLQMLQTFICV